MAGPARARREHGANAERDHQRAAAAGRLHASAGSGPGRYPACGDGQPNAPAPKQRAMIMLEVATAACEQGVREKYTARIDEAFGLATEALTLGERYDSGRVMQRSRMFRRDYAGPVTSSVRAFDRRVNATIA